MKFSFDKLKTIQAETAAHFKASEIKLDEVNKIAAFDITYDKEEAICVGVIVDAKTFEIIEEKHIITKAPMSYVPGFLAFREGPIILQVYYDFEYNADLIFVEGHGIAHPRKCGLATYVGVELAKPTIGISNNVLEGELNGDDIFLEGKLVGRQVITRQHAKPLIVSPGNLIDVDSSAEIVKRCTIYPHKLPEPLHIAHKLASKKLKEIRKNKD